MSSFGQIIANAGGGLGFSVSAIGYVEQEALMFTYTNCTQKCVL